MVKDGAEKSTLFGLKIGDGSILTQDKGDRHFFKGQADLISEIRRRYW